jgi:hypothetical protein
MEFDRDGDGKLDRGELMEFVRVFHGHPNHDGPDMQRGPGGWDGGRPERPRRPN